MKTSCPNPVNGIAEAAMAIKRGDAAIDYSVRACKSDADKSFLDVKVDEDTISALYQEKRGKG